MFMTSQGSKKSGFFHWRTVLVAWLLVYMGLLLLPARGGEFVVEMDAQREGLAQLFFDQGGGFSEQRSVIRPFRSGHSRVVFALPASQFESLRYDPTNNDGTITLRSVRLVRADGRSEAIDLGQIKSLAGIRQFDLNSGGLTIGPEPGATDTQTGYMVPLDLSAVPYGWLVAAFRALMLALFLLLLCELADSRDLRTRQTVSLCLLLVAALALCLAVGSGARTHDHPDEFSHLSALQYHIDYGLVPPAVTDPRTDFTVSPWGFSYLFEVDVIYPITALLLELTGHSAVEIVPGARLFNVALLLLLSIVALRSRAMAFAAAVVLLSPQIWYVYSYFNADALPLTMSLLLVGFAADEDGDVAKFLRGETYRRSSLVALVIVTALLLCSKRNYLPVFPMVGLWLAVRHVGFRFGEVLLAIAGFALIGFGSFLSAPMFGPPISGGSLPNLLGLALLAAAAGLWLWRLRGDSPWRKPFLRLLVLGALCIGAALPRHAWDFLQNGSSDTKAVAMSEVAERLAAKGFKPSELQNTDRYATLSPIRNNIGLWKMLTEWRWATSSLHSAFGYYGYMTVSTPFWLAGGLALLAAFAFLLGGFALRRAFPEQWLALASVAAGGAGLIIWSSLIHSWVNSFNPQGRYLFPAMVLLALPLVGAHRQLARTMWRGTLFVSISLSMVSFVLIAFAAFMAM